MRRIGLIAAAIALVGSACGGQAETESFASTPSTTAVADSEAALVDAMTAQALTNPDRRFDEAAANCMVSEIVDEFGVDGLAELGITEENPSLEWGSALATPEAARRAVDIAMECIDISAALRSFVPADVSLLDETIECVATELQSDTFRDLFVEVVTAGNPPTALLEIPAAQVPIASLLLACLSPDEILQLDDLLN